MIHHKYESATIYYYYYFEKSNFQMHGMQLTLLSSTHANTNHITVFRYLKLKKNKNKETTELNK